jgi:hypothetical protein
VWWLLPDHRRCDLRLEVIAVLPQLLRRSGVLEQNSVDVEGVKLGDTPRPPSELLVAPTCQARVRDYARRRLAAALPDGSRGSRQKRTPDLGRTIRTRCEGPPGPALAVGSSPVRNADIRDCRPDRHESWRRWRRFSGVVERSKKHSAERGLRGISLEITRWDAIRPKSGHWAGGGSCLCPFVNVCGLRYWPVGRPAIHGQQGRRDHPSAVTPINIGNHDALPLNGHVR